MQLSRRGFLTGSAALAALLVARRPGLPVPVQPQICFPKAPASWGTVAAFDDSIDYTYLLPMTRIEIFATNLYMPFAAMSSESVQAERIVA